ncbi:alpha/beta fold hydrolase [Pedobacter hartonius]|uniref:Pimeloyl-ACP methyl ester carboxylesterase n=1 Tax=Pedobacter hartonius TaxID=425514 RepID=A0A1H4DXG2_9SPHI|nr:alpha/beta hydrolase [Pedobacter hartonius]SEA77050.1 Pimeloyl-ACP methyl ester carboxylesterase [Pedobacter hartonius]
MTKQLQKQHQTVRDVELSYSIQGSGSPVLLIHGWPQTQDEWRHVVPLLTNDHTVITVSLPGIDGSGPSKEGYSKKELARYIHDLLVKLGHNKITVVGHDIGGQVAYAYSKQFPEEVEAVVIIDVPIPGLPGWEHERGKWPRWHFAFHQQKDLPEILVRNNVADYLNYFFKGLSYNKQAMNDAEVQPFIEAYSNETTLVAGFELYRAFDQDAEDNKNILPKLKMPVLAIAGEHSRMKGPVYGQLKEAAEQLIGAIAPNCSHYIPEENPEWLAKRIIKFIADKE